MTFDAKPTDSSSSCAPRASEACFDAAIFDMDGVVTRTAALHSTAWKRMFDEFLRGWSQKNGEPFRPFTHSEDYLTYVDGRPRYKGVQNFLESRGIALPFGTASDSPESETVCGLGNRKNQVFNSIVATEGVEVYESTVVFIHQLLERGVRVGLATSSRNSQSLLSHSHTAELFSAVVDGVVSETLGLKGKPEPDIFSAAARKLGVTNERAIVIEDAVAGVQAGSKGGFALVIGLAREANHRELEENGADIVLTDLAECSVDKVSGWIRSKRSKRSL